MSTFDSGSMSHCDINQVIADANSLMESVYRDLALSPRHREPRTRSEALQTNVLSPEAERQIAHIQNVLESVDNNLRQLDGQQGVVASQNVEELVPIPSPIPSSNPVIIDLSNSPSCDDVLFVSQDHNEVIDLDSPLNPLPRRRVRQEGRRTGLNRNARSRSPIAAVVEVNEDKSTNAAQTPVTYNSSKEHNVSMDNNALMCPICMESYANREPHTTKCGHIYCKTCILEAIRLTHKCPICKAKLTSKALIRIFM